jgi:DNA polymerase-3 subunit delta'
MQAVYPWQKKQWELFVDQLQKDRCPHAILVTGSRGIGKKVFATAIAEFLLCKDSTTSKALWDSKNHPDYFYLAPVEDASLIKIDQVRTLITDLLQTSQLQGYKVAIIEADKLNAASSNALLKTLEEPTHKTVLILLHATPEKLMPTLRSRCQTIHLSPSYQQETIHWLEQQGAHHAGELLQWTEGAPLEALLYAHNEEIKLNYDKFLTSMRSFEEDKNPIKVAETLSKLDDARLFEWLGRYLYNKTKQNILNNLAASFKTIDRLNRLVKILTQQPNLNLQLQLENFFIYENS